jgi:alcohol dehydrogenase/propanol-preferring alcohol dehydrogenase
MRAWAVVESGAPLREIEIPTPEPIGTQVLVEVTHCGVCHSDLHNWEGYYDLGGGKRITLKDRGISLPIVLGHEIVGRIAKHGPEAKGVAAGDTRIVYPWVGCGKCATCLQEEDNMCLTPRAIGVFQNGGYGTHVMVPHPRHLFDPGSVDLALAATYACSGITAYSAIRKAMPLPPDEPMVIVGAGGVGLNAVAVLKAMQHRNIVVVDVTPEKRAAALTAGATTAVDGASDNVTRGILEAAGGPVMAVIDFVNGSSTARFAFDALRKGGKLIQVGLFGGDLTIPLPTMALRVLTLQGSYVGSPRDLRDLLALAAKGSLNPMPISTIPKSEVNSALLNLRAGKVVGRVVLTS